MNLLIAKNFVRDFLNYFYLILAQDVVNTSVFLALIQGTSYYLGDFLSNY